MRLNSIFLKISETLFNKTDYIAFHVPCSRGKHFLKRIAANKTAFQSKNLISMRVCTTFCIFYCRPCNLWNVCAREPTQNIRERATRYTHTKKNVKCKIQKLLTGCSRIFHRTDDRNGLRNIIQRTGCGELRMLYSLWFISHIVHLPMLSYMEIYFRINRSKCSWIFIINRNGCH